MAICSPIESRRAFVHNTRKTLNFDLLILSSYVNQALVSFGRRRRFHVYDIITNLPLYQFPESTTGFMNKVLIAPLLCHTAIVAQYDDEIGTLDCREAVSDRNGCIVST